MSEWRLTLAIILTLVLGLALSVAELPANWPDWLRFLRPAWMLLLVFHWTTMAPHRFGVLSAWLLGFGVDVLHMDPLGLNGAILAAAAFIAVFFRARFNLYSLMQQSAVILVLVLAAEAVRQVARNVAIGLPYSPMIWTPAVASAVVWPLLRPMLEQFRQLSSVEIG